MLLDANHNATRYVVCHLTRQEVLGIWLNVGSQDSVFWETAVCVQHLNS